MAVELTVTTAALDYSQLAPFYDEYCVYADDIPYFRGWLRDSVGETLELMAGTGRVSLALARDGARLTCVDRSLPMLAVLRRKLVSRSLQAHVVCADVCSLAFRRTFSLVLLPFQGLTELTTVGDQLGALRAVADVLEPSGRFVCTTHNPAVRLRTVDGSWHPVGTFARPGGGSLSVSLRCTYDPSSGVVVGQQRLSMISPLGPPSDLLLDLRFRLVSLDELLGLAELAGLHLSKLHGDYSGGAYDASTSPALIAVFEKAA